MKVVHKKLSNNVCITNLTIPVKSLQTLKNGETIKAYMGTQEGFPCTNLVL